jgi:hypothetical protein
MVALLGVCCPTDGGSPMEVPSLWINLLFFSEGAVQLDDPPESLDGDQEHTLGAGPVGTSFSFPLPDPEVVLAPPWSPTASVSQICMPWDTSPSYRTMTFGSSSVSISFSSADLAAWSKQIGKQGSWGLMKSSEIGSELSFDSIISNTFWCSSVPRSCSSRVALFSLVYNQVA